MCMFQCYSLNLSHPLLPLLCPQVCSLCPSLYSCPANRVINTIFLDSICVCCVRVLSSVWLFATPGPIRLLCPWNFPGKNTGVVAISYSRWSSWPKDQTWVSCIGRWIFTTEPPGKPMYALIYNICFSLSDLLHAV